MLPFSLDEFTASLAAYNLSIWPVQLIAYLMAGAAIWLVVRPRPMTNRLVGDILTLFWVWVAVMFEWVFLRQIDGGAGFVGALCLIQALLFVLAARVQERVTFKVERDAFGLVGGLIMAYALVAYPVIGALTGDGWPAVALVGVVPAPTIIFTFGLLLWTAPRVPKYLLVIPFIGGLLGIATGSLGMVEDWGAPLAALVATAMILWRDGLALHRPHLGLGHT